MKLIKFNKHNDYEIKYGWISASGYRFFKLPSNMCVVYDKKIL